MAEAWDLVPAEERSADRITTFILFCEDEVNEPSYFRSFDVPEKVKVNPVENQKSGFKNISRTLHHCENTGLMDKTVQHYKLKPGMTTHVWNVFDRDVDADIEADVNPQDNHDFSASIQLAESAGLHVAWSNDVFELWVLLHFEDVTPGVWRHRTYIYDRLTDIFKKLPNQPDDMAAVTGAEKFHYKHKLKQEKFFVRYVLPLLLPLTEKAIERAKKLDEAFPLTHRCHECNPSTRVYKLVESLRFFGAGQG